MIISEEGLRDRAWWEERGYGLPRYDREAMIRRTRENPVWIHFGAGNLFRAYHAALAQSLLNAGATDRGIIVAEGFDYEIVEKMNRSHDDYSILVTLKSDGTTEKTVVGAVAESVAMDERDRAAFGRLREIFAKDSLQLATFTITEKGYGLTDAKEETLPAVAADFAAGPERPVSYMGKVASLLYARYLSGKKPVALVSTDNCSHNGDRLFTAVDAFARAWAKNKKAETGFVDYVNDRERVSFPWSMIDKITPRPDGAVEQMLLADGVEETAPVVTSKKTYAAPFVNAEETQYLVIEDAFPNGRPPLDKAGVIFAAKAVVDQAERMKVCTCLNPLHTALAVFGCLLGYTKISDEMKDPDLLKLVEQVGRREGLPVAVDPGILDPAVFLDTVIRLRLPNPFMPDTPQRIATDTSQKLAVRFGGTIRAFAASEKHSVSELRGIPLVLAGWLRYLLGVDDQGNSFAVSPDPLLNVLRPFVEKLTLTENQDVEAAVSELLRMENIFGVNLFAVGLGETVIGFLREMTAGKGSVRRTLERYL